MLKMGSEKKKKRSRASTKSMISFNDIESMLLNLALVSALLASIILSLVLTITTEELDLADRFYLASRHYLFRHHFRPDATLLPCVGSIDANETMSHIYVMSDYYPSLYENIMSGACRAPNLQLARDIEASVTMPELHAFVESNLVELVRFNEWIVPSYGVSEHTNKCASAMLAAICISVFQYYSLLMSSARQDPAALARWWMPIGFTLTSMGYVLIVYGIYYFLNTLDGIIMVRRAYTYEDGMWTYGVKEVVIRTLFFGLLPATLAQTAWAYAASTIFWHALEATAPRLAERLVGLATRLAECWRSTERWRVLSVNGDEEYDAGEAAWHKCREQLAAAGLEFQLMKDALHEEEGDGPMLLDRAMKDAGVASPGTRLRVLGFLMHTSLSAEDLEHRERRWMADNTDESTKVIAE